MIAVDTNVLVQAHRPEFPFHERAKALVTELAEAPRPWSIPLHCLVEFTGVVTHPKRFAEPSTPEQAADQVRAWRESPSLVLLPDGPVILDRFLELMVAGRIVDGMVHDARIAAACIASGVAELLTCDRDYGRFPGLKTRNPFVS